MSAEDKNQQADIAAEQGAVNETLSADPSFDEPTAQQGPTHISSANVSSQPLEVKDSQSGVDSSLPPQAAEEQNVSTSEKPLTEEAATQRKSETSARRTSGTAEPSSANAKPGIVGSAEEDEDESEEDEVVTSNQGQEGTDDPLGEAYCLDDGSPIVEGDEEVLPWRSDVKSPREFFSTEILYRYDILEAGEQDALKGTYRVELKGQEGGIWSVLVTDQITVENTRNEAEIVLSLHRKDFMNIINGRLNPQLAILAQKIRIKGDTRRAVMFQCLLTPTPE